MDINNNLFKIIIFNLVFIILISNLSFAWTEGQSLDIHVVPFTLFSLNQPENEKILNNAIQILSQENDSSNLKRKLIIPEVYNFKQWWNSVSNHTSISAKVKRLVQDGQVEFVNGGMTLVDEGLIDYNEYLDQLTDGVNFIAKTFHVKPTNAFNINSYGHSEAIAFILSTMGIENMVVNRISREIKNQMSANKHLEFIWKEPQNRYLNTSFSIFTHVTPNDDIGIAESCGPNIELCKQFTFLDKSYEGLSDEDLKRMAFLLLEQYRSKAHGFRTNQLLIPFGDYGFFKDSDYTSKLFQLYETMFHEINKNPSSKTNIRWSTLEDYFKGIQNSEYPIGLAPVKTFGDTEITIKGNKEQAPPGSPEIPDSREFNIFRGDLFSFGSIEERYFTSHFSSIPSLRLLVKNTTNILKSVEHYHSMLSNNVQDKIMDLKIIESCKENIYKFQNHQSIIGTKQQYQLIIDSMIDCQSNLVKSLNKLINIGFNCKKPIEINLDGEVSNSSPKPTIEVNENSDQTLMFLNPLEIKRQEVYRLYVNVPNVIVLNHLNNSVLAQINPVWSDSDSSIIPEENKYELTFFVEIQPFGMTTYTIQYSDNAASTIPANSTILTTSYLSLETNDFEPFNINHIKIGTQELNIENSLYRIRLRQSSGSLERLFIKSSKGVEELPLMSQNMVYNHAATHQSKLIMPAGEIQPIKIPTVLIRLIKGPIVQEVVSYKNSSESPFRKQHIQLINCMDALKHECIDVSKTIQFSSTVEKNSLQQDPIVRFSISTATSSDTNKKNVYYTDKNGLSLVQRKISHFQGYNTKFYPISSVAYIGESNSVSGLKLGIMTRVPLGVAGANEGIVDVMIRSHLLASDGPTVTIPLWLTVHQGKEMSTPKFPFKLVRSIQSPTIAASVKYIDRVNECSTNFNPMISIPSSLQMISFGPLEDDVTFIRYFNTERSKPTSIELGKQLPAYNVNNIFKGDLGLVDFEEVNNKMVTIQSGKFSTIISKIVYQPSKLGSLPVNNAGNEVDEVPISNAQHKDSTIKVKHNEFAPDNIPPKHNSPHVKGGKDNIIDNVNQPVEMIPVIESGTETKERRIQDQLVALENQETDQHLDPDEQYVNQQRPPAFNQNQFNQKSINQGNPSNEAAIDLFKAHLDPDAPPALPEHNPEIEKQKEKELIDIQKQIQERKRKEKERQSEKEKESEEKEKEKKKGNETVEKKEIKENNVVVEVEMAHQMEQKKQQREKSLDQLEDLVVVLHTNDHDKQNNKSNLSDKISINVDDNQKTFDMFDVKRNNIDNKELEELRKVKADFNVIQQDLILQKNSIDQLKTLNSALLQQLQDSHKVQEQSKNQFKSTLDETKQKAKEEIDEIQKAHHQLVEQQIRTIKEELSAYYGKQLDDKQSELSGAEDLTMDMQQMSLLSAKENLYNIIRTKQLEEEMKPKPGLFKRMMTNLFSEEEDSAKKNMKMLDTILSSVEQEIEAKILSYRNEKKSYMKSQADGQKTKDLNHRRLNELLQHIDNLRKQIRESSELQKMSIKDLTGKLLLVKINEQKGRNKNSQVEKESSDNDYFSILVILAVVLTVIYILYNRRRNNNREYRSPTHSSVTNNNNNNNNRSTISFFTSQESKVE